jgi:hypothetical protein
LFGEEELLKMGFRQTYGCQSCGLRATVSGGKDHGFYVETETRYCSHCQTLDDVSLRLWCKNQLPDLLPPSRVEALLEAEKEFGLCPSCKHPGGQLWVIGKPCPKCGGTIEPVSGVIEQWI